MWMCWMERVWNMTWYIYVNRERERESCLCTEPGTARRRKGSHKWEVMTIQSGLCLTNDGKTETQMMTFWFYSCQFTHPADITCHFSYNRVILTDLDGGVSHDFSDARGGYCYASVVNGRCANQNSQPLTKVQCCCDSGRCWSDGSTPEMCPIRRTGGVTNHQMALNIFMLESLTTEPNSCCLSHNRRIPETVHPDPWWEWCSADTWPCPWKPRPTWHLSGSVSWSNARAGSWPGTWSDSWSNSHPGSRSGTDSDSRPSPRANSGTLPRAATSTASSTRYAFPFCGCSPHVHTHRVTYLRIWHEYYSLWQVDV